MEASAMDKVQFALMDKTVEADGYLILLEWIDANVPMTAWDNTIDGAYMRGKVADVVRNAHKR